MDKLITKIFTCRSNLEAPDLDSSTENFIRKKINKLLEELKAQIEIEFKLLLTTECLIKMFNLCSNTSGCKVACIIAEIKRLLVLFISKKIKVRKNKVNTKNTLRKIYCFNKPLKVNHRKLRI